MTKQIWKSVLYRKRHEIGWVWDSNLTWEYFMLFIQGGIVNNIYPIELI